MALNLASIVSQGRARTVHVGILGSRCRLPARRVVAGAAWLARPLPGGVWLGFAVGKLAADMAWYGFEAAARRGVARSLALSRLAKPEPQGHGI